MVREGPGGLYSSFIGEDRRRRYFRMERGVITLYAK